MSPKRLRTVIRELRERAGYTKAELAKKAEITEAYVSMLETGKRKSPSLPVLKKIAKALGVPLTELLE